MPGARTGARDRGGPVERLQQFQGEGADDRLGGSSQGPGPHRRRRQRGAAFRSLRLPAAVSMMGSLLVAALRLAAMQGAEPLRKTDLIRLLTGGALSKSEIADLVRRDCLSFTPTARDRQDLEALGADSAIMGRVDACGRPAAAPASAAVPSRGATAAPPPFDRTSPPLTRPQPAAAPPAAPATPAARPDRIVAVPAAARTGFVSGTGQRGV